MSLLRVVSIVGLLSLACCAGEPDPSGADGGSGRDGGSGPRDAGTPPDAGQPPPVPTCAGSYGRSVDVPIDERALGASEPQILETSGLAASRRTPGVLWAHNDSGDTARLFALRTDGVVLGQVTIPSVNAIDFEDLAAARCPDGSGRPCLWIADSGNNGLDRTDLALYVVPEPEIDPATPFGTRTAGEVWRLPFKYPDDEAYDSEALVVDPDGTDAWLFEKSDERKVRLFHFAGPFGQRERTLERVGKFVSPGLAVPHGTKITGADLHPSRRRLVLRVYTGAFEYRFASTDWAQALVDERALSTVAFVPQREPQGESIAYDVSGTAIWTGSEDPDLEAPVPLHRHDCE